MKLPTGWADSLSDGCFPIALIALIVFLVVVLTIVGTNDFGKKDAFVKECLASEIYTREECIILAGDK